MTSVEYADPDMKVSGTSAQVDQAGGATFEGAKFELTERNARGSADRIQVTRDNQLKLDNVRYTTCPVGEEDWVLRASDIDIRQRAGIGFGRGVRLDFKGVPILYTPFLSFPVGNQRKSGFLFPTLGTSTRSGTSLADSVVLEHRAELRRDLRADVFLQARQQARHRVPLPE